jgi:predicted acylesterase/phospholipase RssA
MGITIVQKSDLSVRKRNPKVALVLAGGAVTGGAFKLGGLKALDDFLVNRKTTDFDTYVGLSAGAVLSAPLAAGVSPAEMIKSLEGKSEHFSRLNLLDFYNPNLGEFLSQPARFAIDVITYLPGTISDVLAQTPALANRLREPLADALRRPSLTALRELLEPIGDALAHRRVMPSALDYLPSGIFDNSSIEQYLRYNFKRAGVPNDFRGMYRKTGKELYISAMNLDTAERVVFGHDEDNSVTVSQAVQASTALPGFYKPARLGESYYVDGGVRRTANLDVAVEHQADLVICYNPFRPFSNRVRRVMESGQQRVDGKPLAEAGILTVLNQVFRTLMHSRLQYGLRQYQEDPSFRGDIVVIEPKETDKHFFQLNALAYWQRIRAAQFGYMSAIESIQDNYDLIKQILESYGITMTRRQVRASVERIREEDIEESSEVLTQEVPTRKLSVA